MGDSYYGEVVINGKQLLVRDGWDNLSRIENLFMNFYYLQFKEK